jgi:hypothetical protein
VSAIILLSGPVGAGKSTVAQELVAAMPGPVACIEGDKFWFFIAKGGREIGRKRNFTTIMTAMIAAAVPYAVAGYHAIVDFSIPPWFLDTAKRIAKVRDLPLDFVVLRPSEKVCAARAAARSEGKIEDYSGYSELYASFDEAEKFIIRDDESDAKTIAGKIAEGLRVGSFRVN